MSHGLSKFRSHVPVKTEDASAPKLPYSEMCEIPGCKSHYIPESNGFPARHVCGKTDVVVNDYAGQLRGVCADHYLRGLVSAGKMSMNELRNYDGSLSATLVKDHWDSMKEEA